MTQISLHDTLQVCNMQEGLPVNLQNGFVPPLDEGVTGVTKTPKGMVVKYNGHDISVDIDRKAGQITNVTGADEPTLIGFLETFTGLLLRMTPHELLS